MKTKYTSLKSYWFLAFVTVTAIGAAMSAVAYASWHDSLPPDDLRLRVAEIIRECLRDGTGNVNGIEVHTKLPIRAPIIAEIRSYGDRLVPILVDHLKADNPQERLIAVNLLGEIGRKTVVSHLGRVIDRESSTMIRIVALRWISRIDDQDAREIIIKTSEKNSDEKVREEARQLRTAAMDIY